MKEVVDCPTQMTIVFLILYLYLSVFHYKYQSYKYERNTAGKSAGGQRNWLSASGHCKIRSFHKDIGLAGQSASLTWSFGMDS